jgi:cold shock CspA family protein
LLSLYNSPLDSPFKTKQLNKIWLNLRQHTVKKRTKNGNISSTPPDPKKKKVINTEDIQIGISRQEDIIDENPVKKGTVTFFNDSKGYGFIKNTETQDSIFVHANGLITQIKEGDKVTFEVEMGQKGPTAVKVSKV